MKSIYSGAFENCTNLKRIIIPDTVTDMSSEAFDKRTVIYTKPNTEAHNATEGRQGYILDDKGPTVWFNPNGSKEPHKNYSIEIYVEDNEEFIGVNESSLKCQWTQSLEKPTKESFTEHFENGQTITKNVVDGEWYLWVYAEDNLGNEIITRSETFCFDNIAPIIDVVYSTKEPTNKVTVIMTSNELIQEVEGWTLSSDKLTLTKEYNENVKQIITIKDLAGNEVQTNIEITNIDKTIMDIMIGDINQDNKIDVTDFLMLKRHMVAGNKQNWKLTENSLLAADMNENGNVDITDMLMLKRKLIDII